MVVTPNPYQSPATTHDHDTLWSKLRRLFALPIIKSDFKHGGKVITDGIAFYLDVTDATRLYAASPSTVGTDARMNLVVSEAIRTFPLFLSDNPRLQAFVRGRKIIVRLIITYTDDPANFTREHILDWDYVSGVLDNTKHDESNKGVRQDVVLAFVFGAIGAAFTAPAIALRVKQRIAWARGFGEFDTDFLGSRMSTDAAVGWLHTFSVLFWVLAAFAVYRIICRWGTVGNCTRPVATAILLMLACTASWL